MFGPLTGELYWEGYLSAFGLTPQEFPAVPSHISKFAYRVILEWANSIFAEMWRLSPYVLGAVVVGVLVPTLFKLPWLKTRVISLSSNVGHHYRRESLVGLLLQATAKLSLALLSLLVVSYFTLMLILLLVAPNQAKTLGLREGERQKQIFAAAVSGSTGCDAIEATGFAFVCPAVIVYGDKSLAVLDRLKVYRIPREGTKVSSTLPIGSSASSASRVSR